MKKKNKIIWTLLFILIGASLQAQTVRSGLESSTAYVGQPVAYTIQISGSEKNSRPLLENFNGFRIEEAGESTSVRSTLINGRSDKLVVTEFSWRLTPLQTGTLTIPSVRVIVDGEEFHTPAGSLRVIEPAPLEGYHLFLNVEDNNLFPRMPSRLTLKWLFSSQVSQPDFSLPFLDNPDLKVVNLPPLSGKSNDIYKIPIGGETVYASQSAEIYKGTQYASLTMGWDIYPSREGRIDLDPVLLSFKRGTGRDSWGNTKYENAVIPSNSLSLKVNPLAEELKNSPGGLLISKDSLKLSLELDQTRVYPGDPVTVTLRFENLLQPGLTEFDGLRDFPELKGTFRVDGDSLIKTVDDDALKIKQTVRVTDDQLSAFPSLVFTYYNQNTGKVEKVTSGALDLDIIPIAAGSGIGTLKKSPSEEPLSPAETELLSIRFNEDLSQIRDPIIRKIPLRAFLLFPPLLFLLVFIIKNLIEGNLRHLLSALLRKDDPLILLKKKTAALNRDMSDRNIRDFNSFIRVWLAGYYGADSRNSIDELADILAAEMSRDKAEAIIQVLEKLDHYCWSADSGADDSQFPPIKAETFYEKSRRKSS